MAKILESARLMESLPDGPNGEKVFKVCLITEGLGNRRNMNYYGPEAVESAVKVYEGKFCYINHQSLDEEETLPERDVRDKAGYWKNLTVTEVDGRKACVGELHCDLSESGRLLAEKVQSSLHYKKEFPGTTREYCGFSVNGDGEAERREMEVEGESVVANYVVAFTDESESCDLVTTPARGGKALSAIRESENKEKENSMKNVKKLLTVALSKLTESAKKLTPEQKKPLEEVNKTLIEAVKEAEMGDGEEMNEADKVDALLAKREGESEADHSARMKAIGQKIAEMISAEEANGEEDPEKDAADPKVAESKRKPTADEMERNLMAIKSLIKESELPEGCYTDSKMNSLARMSFSEAKKVIEGDARLAASILREADIPVASLRSGTRETGGRKGAFLESFKEEN
jgi:hypothetical protein